MQNLSHDYVKPVVQGGRVRWNNVVTACKSCNRDKGGRTSKQERMQLLAIPLRPITLNTSTCRVGRVLADQMDFLCAHFPRSGPLHQGLSGLC